jgi:hypothetical protein
MYRYHPLIVGCSLLCLFWLPGNAWSAYATSLSDNHIQSVLAQHFPVREYATVARITLREPQVRLTTGVDDLVLIIPLDVNIPGQELQQGHVTVLTSISYKAASGELYLHNPRIQSLKMAQLPAALLEDLRVDLEAVVKNVLPIVRIYQLKERDLNHSLAKSALKSAVIDDGRLMLEFGFQ